MPSSKRLYGAIETGGTKVLCAVGHRYDDVLDETRIETTTPAETLRRVVAFFEAAESRFTPVDAIGVAAFGPIDVDPASPTWGRLRSTPKPGWSDADILAPLRARFRCPIVLDTDVNAAAWAELRVGTARKRALHSLVYVTVGTGIGGGGVLRGRTLQGATHAEMGHIHVRRDPRDLDFAGVCPFHGDCLEGLACGPAIAARWGSALTRLGDHSVARSVIGGYLGQLAATISLMLAPQRIVFGGGVMKDDALLPHIRQTLMAELNGYLPSARPESLHDYIGVPTLEDRAGLCGAFMLAADCLTEDAARR